MSEKIKVLLMDDDMEYVNNFGWFLERKGYKVLRAGSGKEGIDVASREKPHIMLCDLIMLDINGDEVVKQVRVLSPNTICVMISAYVDDQTKTKLKNMGAYSYEEKIVKFKTTEEYIKHVLKKHNLITES